LFGTFIRCKRLKLEIDLWELAKSVRVDQRALARLESGDALPTFDSWTIQHIFNALEFTDEEKTMTKMYIDNMKRMEKIVKQYDI
jgi:predicted transcriptional regulator